MNIEPDQDAFLQYMRDLGFSAAEIETNRQHNGRLFLTPAVVFGAIRGEVTEKSSINVATGDLVEERGAT